LEFHPAFAGLNKTAAFPTERDFASLNNLYPALRGLCQLSNFTQEQLLHKFYFKTAVFSQRDGFAKPLLSAKGGLPTFQY
jgi:hypothetical protein